MRDRDDTERVLRQRRVVDQPGTERHDDRTGDDHHERDRSGMHVAGEVELAGDEGVVVELT